MEINIYLSRNKYLKNKTKKQTHRHIKYFDSCQMGRGLGTGRKGVKKYKLAVTL